MAQSIFVLTQIADDKPVDVVVGSSVTAAFANVANGDNRQIDAVASEMLNAAERLFADTIAALTADPSSGDEVDLARRRNGNFIVRTRVDIVDGKPATTIESGRAAAAMSNSDVNITVHRMLVRSAAELRLKAGDPNVRHVKRTSKGSAFGR